MTNELEKQFFDTFGIEPYDRYLNCPENLEGECKGNCNYCDKAEDVYCYPQISDRILLELICILSKYQKDMGLLLEIYEISLDEIKEEILEMLIYRVDGCKHQVRTLFEEG